MTQQILLVDDDADALTMLKLVLQRRGFAVLTAQSGPQALGLLAHETPDAVILDIMMPQMDGYEVCRRIKSDPRTAHLPVALFSAKSQPADQMEGFRVGADDFIEKPVHPDTLIERLNALLERFAAQPEEKAARVISVMGARGGVGATTLAVNLTVTLATDERVILCDLEAGGTAAIHLGLEPLRGWSELLARPPEEIDLAAVEAALTPHASGVRLLAAAETPVDPAHADAILDHLLSLSDVCVFDLGDGGPSVSTLARRSNDFLLALDADRITLVQARRTLNNLREAELPPEALKLVWINRLGMPDEAAQNAIQAALGQLPAASIGPAADALYQALEQGQPLTLGQPEHAAARQIRALAALLKPVV